MISRLAPSTLYLIAAMPQDAKLGILLELQAKDFDLKAFEARVRAACSKKKGPALVRTSSDHLKVAKDIAALLKDLIDGDNYLRLCKLIESLLAMGDPTSLRDALAAVFVEGEHAG